MDSLNKPTPEEAQMLMLRGVIAMMPQEEQDAINARAAEIRAMVASDSNAFLALGLLGAEIAAGVIKVKA